MELFLVVSELLKLGLLALVAMLVIGALQLNFPQVLNTALHGKKLTAQALTPKVEPKLIGK